MRKLRHREVKSLPESSQQVHGEAGSQAYAAWFLSICHLYEGGSQSGFPDWLHGRHLGTSEKCKYSGPFQLLDWGFQGWGAVSCVEQTLKGGAAASSKALHYHELSHQGRGGSRGGRGRSRPRGPLPLLQATRSCEGFRG